MSAGKCPNCGGEVQNGKCLYCDSVIGNKDSSDVLLYKFMKLEQVKQDEALKRKRKRDKRLLVILIALMIAAFITIVTVVLYPFVRLYRESKYSEPSDYTDTVDEDNSEKIAMYKEKGRWYSGMYKVGEDIPMGTYLMVVDGRSDEIFPTSFHALSDVNGENNIINDTWAENTRYITLNDQGYIDVSWSILYDTEKNDIENNPYEHSGMFLVGKDIDPGTYRIGFGPYTDDVKQSPHQSKYTIYSDVDAVAPVIKEHGECAKSHKLTLEEGDFLDLEKCVIIEYEE